MSNLPEGFELDGLPEGFKVDGGGPSPAEISFGAGIRVPEQENTLIPQQGIPTIFGTAEVAKEAQQNIIPSAVNMVEDTVNAVKNYKDTAKGLYKLGSGLVQNQIDGVQGNEKYAVAAGDFYRNRYGTADGFREAITKDPVGVLSDFAFGVGSVAKGAKLIGKVGKVEDVVNAANKGISLANKIDPLAGTVNAVSKGGAKLFGDKPNSMYQGAAKFSTTMPEKERAAITKTALDDGIMPTQKGVDAVRANIDDLNNQITTIIDDAVSNGKDIEINSLFKYLDDVRGDAYLPQQIKAVDNIEKGIKQVFANRGKRKTLTAKEAQRLKQKIYKDVETQYGKNSVPAKTEAQKQVARAAKEEIEKLHPEIKGLNAKEGAYLKLLDALEKSASRIANRDGIGIGVPIKTGAGAAVGGEVGATIGAIQGVLDSPLVKSRLAIILNGMQKGKFKMGAAAERGAVRETAELQRRGVLEQ